MVQPTLTNDDHHAERWRVVPRYRLHIIAGEEGLRAVAFLSVEVKGVEPGRERQLAGGDTADVARNLAGREALLDGTHVAVVLPERLLILGQAFPLGSGDLRRVHATRANDLA